ncbi:hypothetical protein F5X68DRAFT_200801 [Plectosphaerella plurivora]|uniref:Developmental regulator n=1 Tax=Plectosphaerella plurivora TaxID=936078 RepID=A0A9P8VHX2_9PEZI|nr:hypothetical protein F5X68DRAFT_200801 [Plectosphaerella plurivora]
MPAYLCHGFRWHRPSIRVFVVVQNIDEAAPEWIIAPDSSSAILRSFYSLFDFLPDPRRDILDERSRKKIKSRKPTSAAENSLAAGLSESELALPPPTVPLDDDDVLVNDWSAVKLLEEYDPADLTSVSRPYAFVADHVMRVDLSVSVVEEIARYEERMARDGAGDRAMGAPSSDDYTNKAAGKKTSAKKAGWLEKLRDQLQQGEDIRWYVVNCGDEERAVQEDILEESRAVREGKQPATSINGHSRATSRDIQRLASNSEAGPPSRDRSTSASKRVTGGYSPFPPTAQPQPAAPPVLKKPSISAMGVPRPPTREGGPLDSHPQLSPEQFSGLRPPQKSSSLRRLFGRKEGNS